MVFPCNAWRYWLEGHSIRFLTGVDFPAGKTDIFQPMRDFGALNS
jgi:hypothetical protein